MKSSSSNLTNDLLMSTTWWWWWSPSNVLPVKICQREDNWCRVCWLSSRFFDGGVRLIDTDYVFGVRTTESFTVNNPSHHHYRLRTVHIIKTSSVFGRQFLSDIRIICLLSTCVTHAVHSSLVLSHSLTITKTSSRDSTILLTQFGDSQTQNVLATHTYTPTLWNIPKTLSNLAMNCLFCLSTLKMY